MTAVSAVLFVFSGLCLGIPIGNVLTVRGIRRRNR